MQHIENTKHWTLCCFVVQGYMTLDRSCYVIGNDDYPVTATLSSTDNGVSVRCQCQLPEGYLENIENEIELECMMTMLRCPLQQIVNITITNDNN